MCCVIVPIYLAEIAPVNLRGRIGQINQVLFVLGTILAEGLNHIFSKSKPLL